MSAASIPVPFRDALRFWSMLGWISFGGPAGQIGILERELVARRRWLSAEDFQHGLSLAAVLPGPEALKLVIYAGWRLHGMRGGVIAGLGFILPAVFILLGLSFVYVWFGALPAVQYVLAGLAAVVIAMIGQALLRLAPQVLSRAWLIALAAGALLAFSIMRVPFIVVLVAALIVGTAVAWRQFRAEDAVLGRLHALAGIPIRQTWRLLAISALCWLIPAAALDIAVSKDSRIFDLYLAISRIAIVSFGGAYPALAYANAEFVGNLGWLSPQQAAAGLALAETTPGPLVIVLQFFGFMAAWNGPAPLPAPAAAVLGALASSYALFMPSFALMLLAAPFLHVLRRDARIAAAMRAITAVTLVAIVDIGWRFAAAVLWHNGAPQWPVVCIAVAAFVMLRFTRIAAGWLVLSGAVAGLASGMLLA